MTPEEILTKSEKLSDGAGWPRGEKAIELGKTVIAYLQECERTWVSPKEIHTNADITKDQLAYTTQKLSDMGVIEKWGGRNSNWGLTDKGKTINPSDLS